MKSILSKIIMPSYTLLMMAGYFFVIFSLQYDIKHHKDYKEDIIIGLLLIVFDYMARIIKNLGVVANIVNLVGQASLMPRHVTITDKTIDMGEVDMFIKAKEDK